MYYAEETDHLDHMDHMGALEAGAAYALYRHGQDEQTRQLINAMPAATPAAPAQPSIVDVRVHYGDGEDDPDAAPVNALDFTTADMPDTWDDFIGQGPLKTRLAISMKSAQVRGAALDHTLLASGYPGVGKGHDLETRLLTPSGWRRLGDLTVGDAVIGSDGHPTVIADVYERGTLPLYRVAFSDGSSVRCDGDHLWQVQTPRQRGQGRWQTRSVQDMAGDLERHGRARWFVPLTAPVEHIAVELPVEPYLAGVMLGNAEFTDGVIALGKVDFDIAQRIMDRGTELVEYRPHTSLRFRPVKAKDLIRSLGQEHSPSIDKFVPDIYLTAAIGDRRAILAGLLDTDGSVRRDRGSAQFHTISKQLAVDVQTLVESLGGTGRLLVTNRPNRPASPPEYRVDINIAENPFWADRKSRTWHPSVSRGPSRSITSIEYVGHAPVRCIRVVAEDHLYVTERYLVTHNTTMARLIAKTLDVDIIELVPPFNMFTLVAALESLNDRDICFIDEIHLLMLKRRGGDMLLKILEDKVAYMPDGDVIQLNDITIIGATTDKGLLPKTVLDRFKIKPYFQPYQTDELAEICATFAVRHDALSVIDPPLGVDIAYACRGTPRIIEELVLAARDMSFAIGRAPTGVELLDFVEVEADGLAREHVHYITAMRRYFARYTKDEELEYIVGEAAIMQILMETKPGIGNVERFLIERGLIDRTPRGRRLTAAGIARAEALIAQGKGPSDIA